jgi:flagellar biogenesis protein FliO
LGERRFVAVVEFEQSRFLIGGTQASLVLLAPLHNAAEMEEARDEPSAMKAAPGPRVQP